VTNGMASSAAVAFGDERIVATVHLIWWNGVLRTGSAGCGHVSVGGSTRSRFKER
jgi:hypothetical protein